MLINQNEMLEEPIWVKIPDLSKIPRSLPCLVYCKTGEFIGQTKSQILSAEETAKANRFLPELRKNYIDSHVILRQVLSHFTGLQSDKLVISNLIQGKPFLQNYLLKFNLSHSKNVFLIAVSEQEIGVDIEEIQSDLDFDGIMDYAFSRGDKSFCLEHDLPATFTRIWTLKEAYLKAIGTGLSEKLTEMDFTGSESVLNKDGFRFHTFVCPGNEIGSVVGSHDLDGLMFFELL
ncbi:MAG: 4'-phosphopantetheinyl transferase family protein [Bacteroidales bacterium]